jgi:hypothetical protein
MGHDKAQLIVGALESRLLQMNFKWRQELKLITTRMVRRKWYCQCFFLDGNR